ncbi:hypothetical protein HYX06_05510 [Candidatus Woesearchaeota archaeon]|nr:hypothetical protein [Candidatus Woesearchaeota archaeon]
MADQEQPSVQQPQPRQASKWPQRWANIIKHKFKRSRFGRWIDINIQEGTGIPLRYTKYRGEAAGALQAVRLDIGKVAREEISLWQRLRHPLKRHDTRVENLIKLLQRRVEAVNSIEKSWDVFQRWDPDKDQRGYVEELNDIYAKAGIFLDPSRTNWEYPLYERGITQKDLEIEQDIEEETEEERMRRLQDPFVFDKLSINIAGQAYEYIVPAKCKMRYPIPGMSREWIVEISPFGYGRQADYALRYTATINKICDDFIARVVDLEADETIKKNMIGHVKSIRGAYISYIGIILSEYCGGEKIKGSHFGDELTTGYEGRARSFVRNRGVVMSQAFDKIADMSRTQSQEVFSPEKMVYYHSYKIIQPIVYGKRYFNAEIKDELRKYDGYTNPGGGKWYKKPDELDHGLDKYGYPLEVDEDGYVMMDKWDEKGNPTKSSTWRQLPGGAESQFKVWVDTLEMANYITNMHDTYRDDLRDGRFHTGTSTIMDYVEANNASIWNLWHMENENDIAYRKDPVTGRVTGQKYVPVDLLREIPGAGLKKSDIGTYPYLYKVGPTDKNPAFDLGWVKRKETSVDWKHVGRRYYYEVPDHSFAISGQNQEPHISSRGISMYIIEKLMREIRPWNEVMEELDTIGAEQGGLDYGVRPWDMWGKKMPESVFQWQSMLTQINEIIKPKKTAQGYAQLFAIREH